MNQWSRKKPTVQRLARWYARRRLGRNFADVFARGLGPLNACLEQGPALICSNHVAFWDPLVLVHLDAKLNGDGFCLMDEQNLDRLPFFAWLGALPLDRSNTKLAYQQLVRASSLLDAPGRYLTVFGHGAQRPAHLPLEYKAGIFFLARRTGLPVFPMALRYDFHESDRALVHISVGPPLGARKASKEEFLRDLTDATRRELERVDAHLLGKESDFVSLLGRSDGVMTRRLPVGTGVLSRLAAPLRTEWAQTGDGAWHRK